ncbi:Reverse transcriptase zinc-binding domain [Sesbania bispinosa]|nr:Reverse transcriptase zinc-binding domain [Sesbania bispinosa]
MCGSLGVFFKGSGVLSYSPRAVVPSGLCVHQGRGNVSHRTQVWDLIWKWNGPPRVRLFLWTLLRDGLKTNVRRQRCSIGTSSYLPPLPGFGGISNAYTLRLQGL